MNFDFVNYWKFFSWAKYASKLLASHLEHALIINFIAWYKIKRFKLYSVFFSTFKMLSLHKWAIHPKVRCMYFHLVIFIAKTTILHWLTILFIHDNSTENIFLTSVNGRTCVIRMIYDHNNGVQPAKCSRIFGDP